MTILTTILAALCGILLYGFVYYNKKYREEVEHQKHIIKIPASEFMGTPVRRLVQFVDIKDSNANLTIMVLERQGYTYRREYDKGDILCFVKIDAKKGVGTLTIADAAKRDAKNAIILDGKFYNYIEDKEYNKCERCALYEKCDKLHDNFEEGWQSICETLFEWPFEQDHRFEEVTDTDPTPTT